MINENKDQTTPDTATGLPYEDDIASPSDVPNDETPVVTEEQPPSTPEVAQTNTSAKETDLGDSNDSAQGEASTAEQPDDFEEVIGIVVRKGPNPHSEMSSDPSRPLDPRHLWREGEYICVLPCTSEELTQAAQVVKRLDPTASVAGSNWQGAIKMGRFALPRGDIGLNALNRENSMWRQSVHSGGEGSVQLGAGRPKPTERKGDAPLVGEEALQYLQTMLGRGQITRVPLWHSGIWINMKAPTESQLLELERRISSEKINLGRMTHGLAYSNMSVYFNSFLLNFALSMVFDCSIKGFTPEMLKSKILLPDLPLLLWGLLGTIYPDGYRYHRPCVNDPSVCTHVVEEILDISKLCWTDNAALSEVQRKLMVRKTAKFTDIELQNYVSEHGYASKNTVLLKDHNGNKTVVELRVPTLADYEASGFAWIEGIISGTDQAFGSQLTGQERDDYLLDQARATALRQYAHWIERLTFNGKEYIEDRTTLEGLVGQLTGDETVSNNLLNGVRNFINDVTISQIAIPSYSCPVCQKEQNDDEEIRRHPHLIPLDIGAIFFILLGQRTSLLLESAIL